MRFLIVCLVFGGVVSGLSAQDETPDKWATFSKLVFPKLGRSNPLEVQREAIRKFATEDYREAAEFLIKTIKDRRAPLALQLEAAKVLRGFQSEDARALVETTAKETGGTNRYLLEAYIAQGKPESRIFLLNLVKDAETPAIQASAIKGISVLPTDQITAPYTNALIEWVKDESTYHGIRLAAAGALGFIPDPSIIPVLIEQLADPLVAGECRDSLLRLTGETHWMDRGAWQLWWSQVEADFHPEPLKLADYEKIHRKLFDEFGDNNPLGTDFYGRKLEGKNILFLLDNSGSMITNDRINRLKTELEAMISHLTEKYQFGFVIFPKERVPGRDFDEATEKYRERSLEFVNEMTPNGPTPMVEAIEYAFKRVVPKHNVDTIYLLSDGQPSDLGKEDLTNVLLKWNEIYGAQINTIFIGDDIAAQALMEQVAKDSGGSFLAVP